MIYTGNHKLGDLFKSRREKGSLGLPLLSVTLTNGMVDRKDLGRKLETELTDEEHLVVHKGDIVYNMMRMWQGASGLATKDGIISPAYIVLAPKTGIDPQYASYLFKTKRLIYLFWAYSYGLTDDRLRLYFSDFAKIPVNIPKLNDQRAIAKIIATWEKAITVIEKLIINSKAQQVALMQQMITGKKRLNGFNGIWRDVSLGEIGTTYSGLSGKTKDDFGQGAPYIPYINIYNNSRIDIDNFDKVRVGKNEKQNLCKFGDIFFTTSSETPEEVGMASVLLDDIGKLYLNSFCFGYRLNDFKTLHPNYARYLLRGGALRRELNELAQGSTRFNLSKKGLMKIKLSLPPIDEQLAISTIIENSENQVSLLEKQLAHIKQEKNSLAQQLFTGKRRVKAEASQTNKIVD